LGPLSWTNASAEVDLGGGGFFPGKAELTIYLPDGPGPFPVVVFSHGFQLGPENYVSYGEHLASWGFVAVLPKFPGSLIVPRTHAQLKEDLSAILDWIEGAPGELSGKADASKIGLSGHSMGGKISLLLASSDDRAKAAFVVDPVDSGPPFALNPFDYPSVAPELMADIAIPLGILGETTSSEGGLTPCAPADENFQQYYKAATSPALQIDMIGASHMSFLDDPNCGFACSACPAGSDDPAVTRALTLRVMTAFYLTLLNGDPVMASWLTDWDNLDPATADLVDIELKNGF
jgi:predicted dienelactone hydrolase